jgi:hypothetical protein
MPPSDHSARRRPPRRNDSTHPANTRPATHRGADRRPYPTASTTTRVSPAKPGSRTRSHGSTATPTPATVWTSGPAAIDLDTAWPTPIISTIVSAFSKPSAHVVLLPWPAPPRSRLGVVDPDGTVRNAPGTDPDDGIAAALAAVERLDRAARVVHVPADANVTKTNSRAFRSGLIGSPEHTPMTTAPPPPTPVGSTALDAFNTIAPDTDLVITSLRPADGGNRTSDLVALVAARLLRAGGILAILTHCDWPHGELLDPTGTVVASAQNADLLYLQHIVALHVPVRDGRFATELLTDTNSAATEKHARVAHRALVRGLPAPHRRIHSDLVVFAQPQREPLPGNRAGQAHTGGLNR